MKTFRLYTAALTVLTICGAAPALEAQSVTEIITDYNGYWKTSSSSMSTVKPDNDHNLLSFTFNGTRYSTGVNDALLTAHGETFVAGDYLALPMNNLNGAPTSNTKVGLGAMKDGVYNGTSTPGPSRTLAPYLNDGPHGLNIGTCVANLPAGTMFMAVTNLNADNIGDGVPDIIVTQIADPSTKYDRYEFTDINGNRVGNYMDIVLPNITPVGTWIADFFEATGSSILTSSFTQTQRNIRLWAADFSAFGINASNIGSIAYFKIGLSGDSDIAFVAYNATTVTVNQILAMPDSPVSRQPIDRVASRKEITDVSVYPNPAVSSVNVIHPVSKGGEKILIYSAYGVLLREVSVAANTTQTAMPVYGLFAGAYHLVYTDGREKLTTKLLVK